MPGYLTTHVLDTARGRPAEGIKVELWSVPPSGDRTLLTTATTNVDGRTPTPMLQGDGFSVGVYELVFMVGDYFASQGLPTPDPPFLDPVPIRFGIADGEAHYHVPLLVSPWSYST